VYLFLRKIYSIVFSSNRLFEKINSKILDLSLSAKGYNNCRNFIESGERYFVRKYLSNEGVKLCIDIGANNGRYTRLLLEETNAKVISFEPLPFVFNEMVKNLSNYSQRCTFVNKGVGAKNESLLIHYNKNESDHASFSEEIKKIDYVINDESLKVEVVSLTDYCKNNDINEIDFIKIDTEGFEKEVLEGLSEVIERIKPKFIQIEYNWHHLFRNTSIKYFSEKLANYNVYQLTYNNMRIVDVDNPLTNIYMFSNFVFLRKDIS